MNKIIAKGLETQLNSLRNYLDEYYKQVSENILTPQQYGMLRCMVDENLETTKKYLSDENEEK